MKKLIFALGMLFFLGSCNFGEVIVEPELDEQELYFDGGKDEAKKRDRDAPNN